MDCLDLERLETNIAFKNQTDNKPMAFLSKIKRLLFICEEVMIAFCSIILSRISASKHLIRQPHRVRPILEVAFKSFSKVLKDSGPIHFSTSQSGEDIIVNYIFKNRGISTPTYLDIGAHDPILFSNTALFYAMGSRGINVEPNPKAHAVFNAMRPDDINLACAVSDKEGEAILYIPLEEATLASINTEPDAYVGAREVAVPTITLSTILDKYANGKFPDFLSLDVEGVDYQILQQIPFERTKPKVICIETISYSTSGMGEKDTRIFELLLAHGYIVYADTNINTIFVDKDLWVLK
jgi:FkbM family methyltransferase